MRKLFPRVEASDLVLNLDSEDCEIVRPFDEEIDGVPMPWASHAWLDTQPIMSRIAQFESESGLREKKFRMVKNDPFHPCRLNDLDLISVALAGVPPPPPVAPDGFLEIFPKNPSSTRNFVETLLDLNGIPPSVRTSTHKTLAYMRHRQDTITNPSLKLQSSLATGDKFERAVSLCHNLKELERVILPQVSSADGFGSVGQYTHLIAQQCQNMLGTAPEPLIEILGFMNDLAINFASSGLGLSNTFKRVALRFALECENFTVAQRYVEACLTDAPHFPISGTRHGVLRATLDSLDRLLGEAAPPPPHGARRHLEIYSFLTGWTFGDRKAHASMHLFYRKSYDTQLLYLTSLARLGAFRTMWYEWHDCLGHGPKLARPQATDTTDDGKQWPRDYGPSDGSWKPWALGMMARLYTEAILESPQGARPGLRGGLLECVDFTKARGDHQADCELDMETIIRLGETSRQREGGPPETAEGAPPSGPSIEERKYDGRILEIFNKSDVSEALAGLGELLEEVNMAG